MKHIFLIASSIALFVFAGCEENDDFRIFSVTGSQAIIPWQDCAYFADHGLTICFVNAKEERCPCNTECLWEGSVDAMLHISSTAGIDTTITLTTNSDPGDLHYFHTIGNKTIVFVNTSGIECTDYGQFEKYKVIVRME